MYLVVSLYDSGYKIRFASENPNDIIEKYKLLDSINIKDSNLKIIDTQLNDFIEIEKLIGQLQ